MPFSITKLTISCLISCALVACSSSSKSKNEPKELTLEKEFSVDESEITLFNNAKELYQDSLFSSARNSFETLRKGYPTGAYREFAELKAADTFLLSKDFQSAAQRYEQFSKDHPKSSSIEYAKFMFARCLQLQNKGPGRNMIALDQAIEAYEKFLNDYPQSILTYAAKKQLRRSYQIKRLHSAEVAEFYRQRDAVDAIAAREALIQKHSRKRK